MTEPITEAEHFVVQTSDITTASHALLKPHNGSCCPSLLNGERPVWKSDRRRFMKYEMWKEERSDGPVCLSITAEGVDGSPEGAAVSLPFILVKFSTRRIPGTPRLLAWVVNRSEICASLTA